MSCPQSGLTFPSFSAAHKTPSSAVHNNIHNSSSSVSSSPSSSSSSPSSSPSSSYNSSFSPSRASSPKSPCKDQIKCETANQSPLRAIAALQAHHHHHPLLFAHQTPLSIKIESSSPPNSHLHLNHLSLSLSTKPGQTLVSLIFS